jgi:hypothetical protein
MWMRVRVPISSLNGAREKSAVGRREWFAVCERRGTGGAVPAASRHGGQRDERPVDVASARDARPTVIDLAQVGNVASAGSRRRPRATGSAPPETPPGQVLRADILRLQSSAGNRAAMQLLPADGRAARPASIQRERDPELDAHVSALRAIARLPYTEEGLYETVVEQLRGVDLTDSANLVPVTEVLVEVLPPDVFQRFLTATDRPNSRGRPPSQDPARLIRDLNNPPRGQYGIAAPGVAPFAGELVRPLVEPLTNAMSTVEGLMRGLYRGVAASASPAAADELAENILESTILNTVFPPVFMAGTTVGIASDAVETIRGVVEAIVNLDEVIAQATSILEVVVSPDGEEFGRILGEEIGSGWGRRLVQLSGAGVFEFTFEVGKIAGPAVVYTVCAFLGLPALAAGAVFARVGTRLLPLLRRFPRLAALARRISSRLGRSAPPDAPNGARPRLRGYTAEGIGDEFTHGPLPESPEHIPTTRGRGPLRSETEMLTTYAGARRPRPDEPGARDHPATAAARGPHGPHIRDNLYTGGPMRQAVRDLQRDGILRVSRDATTIRVLDPDRYLAWLEAAYRQHGGSHLDPRMADAVRSFVGGGRDIPGSGGAPGGGRSFAGSLPGTHAELLAVNDSLLAGAVDGVDVVTVRARDGAHFAACLHCRGILDRVPSVGEVRVRSGAAVPVP